MITCRKSDGRIDYSAPLISNGELSVTLDYSGAQTKETVAVSSDGRRIVHPTPEILLAGRRYGGSDWTKGLITYGFLSQQGTGNVIDWEQSLSYETASTITNTHFDNNLTVKTEAFVSLDANILAIKKQFTEDCDYTFTYNLASMDSPDSFPKDFKVKSELKNGILIDYEVEGRIKFIGTVRFVCSDSNFKPLINNNKFSYSGKCNKNAEVCFYLVFSDNVSETTVEELDWNSLYNRHCENVRLYNSEGYVELGDDSLNKAYQVASYHLRCVSTPWGIPTGVFRTHWSGVYFSFDEFYMLDALLSSNHLNNAKKCVNFRARMLNVGLRRAAYMERFPEKMQARYPWVANEDGKELSSSGYYNDHIFHMANIAMGAWEYYKHSGDKEFLCEKLYPVIKACAGFYHFNMIYRLKEGTVIGHCTDLERLGPSIQNAYMTTCSAIVVLRIFAEAANILGRDEALAKECAEEADELFLNLPNDGKKYVAYPGFKDASVAVITGTYPYRVHEKYNELEDIAVKDYVSKELIFGNMYAEGKKICSWYSLWKAIYYIRRFYKDEAYSAVKQAIEECGAFNEMFEINENAVSLRPWFSTASAFLVTAVNEMLLQNEDDGSILLLPCLPEKVGDVKFKLSAHNNMIVELELEDNIVKKLKISGKTDGLKFGMPDYFKYDGKVLCKKSNITYYSYSEI